MSLVETRVCEEAGVHVQPALPHDEHASVSNCLRQRSFRPVQALHELSLTDEAWHVFMGDLGVHPEDHAEVIGLRHLDGVSPLRHHHDLAASHRGGQGLVHRAVFQQERLSPNELQRLEGITEHDEAVLPVLMR